jgi:hypothetical protein
MIRLGGLISQKAFGKFEMGKVISNPYANAFIKEAEGSEDHEVSMANNSLDTIIKMATELKAKMGEDEKDIPAWIQDHITNAENFISQASSNYHEYGTNEAAVSTGEKIQNLNNRIKALKDKMAATKSSEQKNLIQQRLKNALQSLSNYKKQNISKENVVNEGIGREAIAIAGFTGTRGIAVQKFIDDFNLNAKKLFNFIAKGKLKDRMEFTAAISGKSGNKYQGNFVGMFGEAVVTETSPCWKGYKQVGMKDKGGRQVPNCVPNK